MADQAIPWGYEETKDILGKTVAGYVPCNKADFARVANKTNTHVCIGVKARNPSDTFDIYETTTDPLSPWFASTCYLKERPLIFDSDPPAAKRLVPEWRHPRSCTTCRQAAENSFASHLPTWRVLSDGEACVNCNLEFDFAAVPAPPTTYDDATPLPWQQIGSGWGACDGIKFAGCGGSTQYCEVYADSANADTCDDNADSAVRSCFTAVRPVNKPSAMTKRECYTVAKRNQAGVCAGGDVMWSDRTGQCFCYRSDLACCKPCDHKGGVRYTLHFKLD